MFAASKITMGGKQPPKIVSSSSVLSASAVSTVSLPATTGAIGLLQVVFFGTNANGVTLTPPAGWTEVIDTGSSAPVALFWRDVVADDTGPQVFTISTAVNRSAILSALFSNASFDASLAGVNATTTNPATVASMTAQKGLLVACGSLQTGSSVWATPSGMSVVIRQEGTGVGLAMFQQEFAGGSTPALSMTNSFSAAKRAVTFSIKAK